VVASAENTPSVAVDSFPFLYYTHTPPPPSAVVVQAYSQDIPSHSLSLGNLLVAAHSNLRRGLYDHGTRVPGGSENGAVCMVGHMHLVVRVRQVVVGNRSIGMDSLLLRVVVDVEVVSIRDGRTVNGIVDGEVGRVVRDGSNRRNRGMVGGNVLLAEVGIVHGVVDNEFEMQVVEVEIDVSRVESIVLHPSWSQSTCIPHD
jgi:hypothetical protein